MKHRAILSEAQSFAIAITGRCPSMQRNPTNVAVMENVETDEARFFNLACMRQRAPGIEWEPPIPSHAEQAEQKRQATNDATSPDPIVEDFPYTSKQSPSEDSDLTEE